MDVLGHEDESDEVNLCLLVGIVERACEAGSPILVRQERELVVTREAELVEMARLMGMANELAVRERHG